MECLDIDITFIYSYYGIYVTYMLSNISFCVCHLHLLQFYTFTATYTVFVTRAVVSTNYIFGFKNIYMKYTLCVKTCCPRILSLYHYKTFLNIKRWIKLWVWYEPKHCRGKYCGNYLFSCHIQDICILLNIHWLW